MPIDRIPLNEFASRRTKLLAALKAGVALVFAGSHDPDSDTPFRPDAHFEYLTGIVDEPGAVLLLDPANPVEDRRSMLLLAPLNPEREKWDGYRLQISRALRERTGLQAIFRTEMLPRLLNAAAVRRKRLACLHPPAQYDQPISPDLALFTKVAQRLCGIVIEDRTDTLAKMRAVKSRNEIAMIQRAIDITAGGFEAMMRSIRPGMNEFDVQEIVEHGYRTHGSRGAAFPTIAGSGVNSTVLHYCANDQPLRKGDLICVDSGASFGGYGADITRTVPVSGRFTKRQREVYEITLKAQRAAIQAIRPGVMFAKIDDAARGVIDKAGLGDFFIHGIGHHLGLQTHDISPDAALRQGAVVTIEPGIYIPAEKIGIRIEDDILVSRTGAKNLSAKIPKTVAAIEKLMARQ